MKRTSSKSKTIKLTNVKGTIVRNKDGVHIRSSHNRKMEVNIDSPSNKNQKKDPQISDKLSDNLKTGKVDSVTDLRDERIQGGLTDGVKYVKMRDSNGKKISGFFKDAQNEPFDRGDHFVRQSVKLNNRENGSELSKLSDYRNLRKNETDFGRDKYKGHLLDREAAVAILGKTLGMDHLPDAAIRKVNIDGKEQTGIMVRDIREQFKKPGATIGKAYDVYLTFMDMARTDKKLGDKLAFDLLIGNTDRHYGNVMVRSKNNKHEFLAFDQGLSFPNSNKTYTDRDFTNQHNFLKNAGNVPLTANFVEKFGDFLNDGGFEKMRDYIKENIGDKEADAFTERTVFFAYEMFFEKSKTVGDMKFLSKTWNT